MSSTGTFAEYYHYKKDKYVYEGGNLRPWESGINAYALLYYLFGITPVIPNNHITFAPHLTEKMGAIGFKSYKVGLNSIDMDISREENGIAYVFFNKGISNPLNVELLLGGLVRNVKEVSINENMSDWHIRRSAYNHSDEYIVNFELPCAII
jgi:hypothetical protein